MKVESTWLNIKDGESGKKLVVNLKWLLAWRSITGLCIKDEYINREIELSNGNLKWVDKDFECLDIHKPIIMFMFNRLRCVVHNDKFNIEVITDLSDCGESMHETEEDQSDDIEKIRIEENIAKIKLETDLDAKVQKLNKRLSLLGSNNTYKTTNGTSIITMDESSKIDNYDDIVGNTLFTYEMDINVKKDLDLNVDNCDFVNLGGLKYDDIALNSNKGKHLQYINGYVNEHDDSSLEIGSNISMEEAAMLNIWQINHMIDVKRVNECFLDLVFTPDYMDLSQLDYVDHLTITDEDGFMMDDKTKIIDFKDKFIIFKGAKYLKFYLLNLDKLIIRSSNKETYYAIGRIVDRLNSPEKRIVKLEFTGEQ